MEIDGGTAPTGSVVLFHVETDSWGYDLILPSSFIRKKGSFRAAMADFEPADSDGVTYQDMVCTVSN